MDDASRFYFEETHELKLKILRLEDQVKLQERRNVSEESLAFEKIQAFENHIELL